MILSELLITAELALYGAAMVFVAIELFVGIRRKGVSK